jgi:hypothetical protein
VRRGLASELSDAHAAADKENALRVHCAGGPANANAEPREVYAGAKNQEYPRIQGARVPKVGTRRGLLG